jgi:hypothetical protein
MKQQNSPSYQKQPTKQLESLVKQMRQQQQEISQQYQQQMITLKQ